MNEIIGTSLHHWNVYDIYYQALPSSYAVIILNSSLESVKNSHVLKLWKSAAVRICVDGGANELYNLIYSNHILSNHYGLYFDDSRSRIPYPHIISGDFDSVDPFILRHFEEKGVQIVPTMDQNETDFTKSLLVLRSHLEKCQLKIKHVIVIAGINSRRFDHVIGQLNTLYKVKESLSVPVIIMSTNTLMWLLLPGSHRIEVPSFITKDKDNSWCGYAPLSDSAIVSTKGLKWNLEDEVVCFGKTISTSNTYDPEGDGSVMVQCSKTLLWFMGCTS